MAGERQELMISQQKYSEMLNIVIGVYTQYWKHKKPALPTLVQPFKDEAQTALFKDPVRTAL
jgi:hypothetical protein